MLNDKLIQSLPIYEVKIDDDEELGVVGIALVQDPAILVGWVAQSKHGKTVMQRKVMQQVNWVMQESADKMLVTGPLSIPGQQIYREDEEIGPHFITYSSETIRKMSERFLTKGNQLNLNMEHTDKPVMGSVVESWIKESEADKSVALGYDLPVGTWFISVKVADPQVWQQQIKTQKVKGFSLEGMFGHEILQSINHVTNEEPKMSTYIEQGIKALDKQELATYQAVLKEAKKLAKQGSPGLQQHLTKLEADNGMDYYFQNRSAIRRALTKASEAPPVKQSAAQTFINTVRQLLKQDETPLEQMDDTDDVEEVKQMEYTLADGTTVVVDEMGMALINGEPAPEGQHALSDGSVLVVDANGMFIEVLPATEEDMSELAQLLTQIAQSQKAQDARMQRIEQALKLPADASPKAGKTAPVNQGAAGKPMFEVKLSRDQESRLTAQQVAAKVQSQLQAYNKKQS